MVKVTKFGAEVVDKEFKEGLTVAEYLAQAGAEVNEQSTVSLNGRKVTTDTPVTEDNAVIVVAPKIANGR